MELIMDRFEVHDEIGSGRLTRVYKGFDRLRQCEVAVKRLREQFAGVERVRARFLNEARAMAAIDDPHVVRVWEVDLGDTPAMVMDFVRGGTVLDRVRANPDGMPPQEAARIASQALAGIAAAHAVEIVHRDVEPGNILLEPDGTVRVGDFGVARLDAVAPASLMMTMTGESLGSFRYMAPEQRRDPRSADPRSDIYGMGATLFHMLTGRPPPDLSRKRDLQGIPAWAATLIAKATHEDPADRFPTAAAMRDELTSLPS